MLFDAGVLIGHFQQAVAAGNFSPDNFGALQIVTALHIILFPILLIVIWRKQALVANAAFA